METRLLFVLYLCFVNENHNTYSPFYPSPPQRGGGRDGAWISPCIRARMLMDNISATAQQTIANTLLLTHVTHTLHSTHQRSPSHTTKGSLFNVMGCYFYMV